VYCALLCRAVSCWVVLCCAALHCDMQYCSVPCNTVLHCTVLYFTVQCCATFCSAALYCAITLYQFVKHFLVLCYAALYCKKRFDWGIVQCLIAFNFSTDNNIFIVSVSVENKSNCCYLIMYWTMTMIGFMIYHITVLLIMRTVVLIIQEYFLSTSSVNC
jgi:hypothetical protein